MFSSIGWSEILAVVIIGLIVIGPERLPGVIKDVQAAIYAARKAIANARAELDGEFGDITKEFDELRGPLSQVARLQRMSPRSALTQVLFDGDSTALDDLDPRTTARPKPAHKPTDTAASASAAPPQQQTPPRRTPPPAPPAPDGFDWNDIM